MHIITMAKGARESSHGDWIRFRGARAKVEGCEKSLLKYLAALQRGARAKLSVLHTDRQTHTHTLGVGEISMKYFTRGLCFYYITYTARQWMYP